MSPDISARDLPDDGWCALASVGVGYAIATGLIFVVLFVAPYLIVRAL